MPQLRNILERAQLAESLALSFQLVEYEGTLYMPVHFLTAEPGAGLTPDETVWKPLSPKQILGLANIMGDILFVTDGEIRSFRLMLAQLSIQAQKTNGILIRVREDKVMLLNDEGTLIPATGLFVPNYLDVPYDEHSVLTDELFGIISEWVGGKEQATSLLHHLATILQSTWSAVKYVILIGTGRNGKSTLLKMVHDLIGEANISGVSRQDMAAKSATISSLNGKLANIIMDGPKEFLKDSSTEKTLIAGEALHIEMKFENAPFRVQTNSLFIEGLQQEPKVSDKSAALQKRLVRFRFPNEYPLNLEYEEQLRRPEMLAALLSLMLAHWVNKDEVATKLAITAESMDLQMEAVWAISPVLRFLEYTTARDNRFLPTILDGKMWTETFIPAYRAWLDTNGYKNVEDDYILQMVKEHFEVDRKSFRVDRKPTTKRYLSRVLPDTMNAINMLLQGQSLKEGEDAAVLDDVEGR